VGAGRDGEHLIHGGQNTDRGVGVAGIHGLGRACDDQLREFVAQLGVLHHFGGRVADALRRQHGALQQPPTYGDTRAAEGDGEQQTGDRTTHGAIVTDGTPYGERGFGSVRSWSL
jgi:hypothetical protein